MMPTTETAVVECDPASHERRTYEKDTPHSCMIPNRSAIRKDVWNKSLYPLKIPAQVRHYMGRAERGAGAGCRAWAARPPAPGVPKQPRVRKPERTRELDGVTPYTAR